MPIPAEIKEEAAKVIQRSIRAHNFRNTYKRREIQRRLLIGMVEPSWRPKEEFIKFENNLEKRRVVRDQHIRDYIKANLDERARVLRVVAPGLFEDIGDEIREW